MSDYRTPRDTAEEMRLTAGQMGFLAASTGSRGLAGAVEEQEAAGQREIVRADVIPAKGYSDDALTVLGFTLGPAVDGDPQFRRAALPEGWTRKPAEDPRGSYLLDDLDRRRCTIFYKAAFYDRDAYLTVVDVSGYVYSRAYEKQPIVFDDVWATRDAVLTAIDEFRAADAERAREWTGLGNAAYAREYAAKVTAWDAYRAQIAAQASDSDEDLSGEARCRMCGCTENSPCEGGCRWVPDSEMDDLCSACNPGGVQ